MVALTIIAYGLALGFGNRGHCFAVVFLIPLWLVLGGNQVPGPFNVECLRLGSLTPSLTPISMGHCGPIDGGMGCCIISTQMTVSYTTLSLVDQGIISLCWPSSWRL